MFLNIKNAAFVTESSVFLCLLKPYAHFCTAKLLKTKLTTYVCVAKLPKTKPTTYVCAAKLLKIKPIIVIFIFR